MSTTRGSILLQIIQLRYLAHSNFGCGEYLTPTGEDKLIIEQKIRDLRGELKTVKF